jgi:hypothetical protein
MIGPAICLRAEFIVLPSNHDSSGLSLSQILPPDAGINIPDPLTRPDVVGLQVGDIGEKQFRTKTILHDSLPIEKDGIG